MSVHATTHLNLRGTARQALGFYQQVFGGHASIVTYEDAGNVQHADEANHVMWGQVSADSGFRVMAYDVPANTPYQQGENAFFVAVESSTADELTPHWNKLSEGASIVAPLQPAGWSPLYGMLKDRFGVMWSLSVAVPYEAGPT